MNTKRIKITFLLLFVLSIIFMTVFYIHSSSKCITVNNIENYQLKWIQKKRAQKLLYQIINYPLQLVKKDRMHA